MNGSKRLPGVAALRKDGPSMKTVGKALLYVMFLGLAVFCFQRFRGEYSRADIGARRFDQADGPRDAEVTTNDVPLDAGTNAVAVTATNAPATPGTHSDPTSTNAATAIPGTVASGGTTSVASTSPSKVAPKASSKSGLHLAGFVGSMLVLAILLGWDVTQWVASRSTQALGVDVSPIQNDPEYDSAEAEWAKGNHLDAINLLRDFLKRNPSQQHAAIRIAEIYEKDLANYLAAALELEEVLTKRLPREKWGWTAIHLANIYSGRLNQSDKALATLDRIVRDYPDTAAAKKARQRLGLPDPVDLPAGEMAAENLAQESEDDGNPAMPKGFKPRKR
jgi:TolA-binding protein